MNPALLDWGSVSGKGGQSGGEVALALSLLAPNALLNPWKEVGAHVASAWRGPQQARPDLPGSRVPESPLIPHLPCSPLQEGKKPSIRKYFNDFFERVMKGGLQVALTILGWKIRTKAAPDTTKAQ